MGKSKPLREGSKCHFCNRTSGRRKTFQKYKIGDTFYTFCRRGHRDKYIEQQNTPKDDQV